MQLKSFLGVKMENKKRCKWCNLKNELYIKYHDNEWCVPNFDEKYLYEMLILESFQAGLSWECILNKRENFRKAYDDFCKYFWNSGMGVPPSFDEWLDWYQSAMGENGYYYAYSESRYYWVPLGDILPLILLALLHLVVMYFRTKFRTRVND